MEIDFCLRVWINNRLSLSIIWLFYFNILVWRCAVSTMAWSLRLFARYLRVWSYYGFVFQLFFMIFEKYIFLKTFTWSVAKWFAKLCLDPPVPTLGNLQTYGLYRRLFLKNTRINWSRLRIASILMYVIHEIIKLRLNYLGIPAWIYRLTSILL